MNGRRWAGFRRLGAFSALLVALATAAAPAAAQLSTVRGRVVEARSTQPLPGATVVLAAEGSRLGTTTDAEGLFVLSRLTPGRYVLTVSFVGYEPFADTLTLAFGDQPVLEVALRESAAALSEVVVESDRAATDRTGAGLLTVRPSALERVPLPDVSGDLAAYLVTVPGVVTAGDRGGQLFVRGGTPTQNLILLDGMQLYQPFHIVGFYSAFPADLVAYADVYAGGFGARYGGRLSSVVDVATRNGNKQRVAGAVSAAPFLSAARLEVPLLPEQASLVLSLRESIIERLAPDLLGRNLPYRFGDRFGKFHAFLNRTTTLSLTALRTFDEGNVDAGSDPNRRIAWRNAAYGGRYVYLPEDFPVLAEIALYTSRYESDYGPEALPERVSDVEGYNAEINFAYLLGSYELRFGLFGRTTAFRYRLAPRATPFEEYLTEGGTYLEGRLPLGRGVRVEPGLRLHSFPSRGLFAVEPRLRAAWRASARLQLSAAAGIFHQQIVGLTNPRDVTDVFVAWAPAPQGRSLPRADHVIVGGQVRPRPWLELGAEVYAKRLTGAAVPDFRRRTAALDASLPARGWARGLDLRAEVTRPFFYGLLDYSLAGVWYEPDGEAGLTGGRTGFHPAHDRRHQLQALARLLVGRFSLSARWQYGSGLPFTPLDGYYDALFVQPGDPRYRTSPGTPAAALGPPYSTRLPAYHRLDLMAERTFHVGRAALTLQGALINAYDRRNLFDYDAQADRRVDQLPLIPSLGLKMELE